MSLPNELKKIKSSGIYRYVWDKSIISDWDRPTLRLLVGYSDKGPFNTPVYIKNKLEFELIYGKVNRKLERKGIYFHRAALLALLVGPILALNLKPFKDEFVDYLSFDSGDMYWNDISTNSIKITDLYDTNRFWKINESLLVDKLKSEKYINITNTETDSYSVFIRPIKPVRYRKITILDWYSKTNQEIPEFLEPIKYTNIDNYFVLIFIFKTNFTPELCRSTFPEYFNIINNHVEMKVGLEYIDQFGEPSDALEDLSNDPNANFVGMYEGCTIPYFKNYNNEYESIDVIFNSDFNKHKMIMLLNSSILEDMDVPNKLKTLSGILRIPVETFTNLKENVYVDDQLIYVFIDEILRVGNNHPTKSLYLRGYTYNTVNKNMSNENIQETILSMLNASNSISTALTNNSDVEYHYLVDTFESYIENGCKNKLSMLMKKKGNSFALLNFPKMENFIDDSRFKNNITLCFDMKTLLQSEAFSLPSESEGADRSAFFTQALYTDGTLKIIIPSAAIISNCFVKKYLDREPFEAVAGRYGILEAPGVIGADYNFDSNDRGVLEHLGVNPLLFKDNTGAYVTSNLTAKQLPLTGTSFININELIIYILDEVENILLKYQWEFNNGLIRSYIKLDVTNLCEKAKNNGGIRDYKIICDETNNTPDIIDMEILVVDIHLTPTHCTSKMILRLKINKIKSSK